MNMNKFNKFLKNGEALKKIVQARPVAYKKFIILFLILIAFFILFPMWQAGRQGIYLWAGFIIILLFLLSKQLIQQEHYYLLTNRRIINITKTGDQYLQAGFIKLSRIKAVKKRSNNIILILINNKNYYLASIYDVDTVFNFVQSYLKKQNLL